MSGCARQNHINFSSSEAFFSSLNQTNVIQKEKNNNISKLNNLKKKKINDTDEKIIKKPFSLTLLSYKKQLKQKIDLDELVILKVFNNPSLKIKHGKIKNFQFHLKSCHLDLFFLNESETYKFRHFDIRPSSILSSLNEKKCVEELNNKFTLIRDPK
jgi:hypothetical protein